MGLVTYNPTSPGRRFLITTDRSDLWKGKPVKTLTEGLGSSGGRNNVGRITSRHRGGGHKRSYRLVDFKRTRFDAVAIADPSSKLVLASDYGYGFVTKFETLLANKKAGKQVLNIDEDARVLAPAPVADSARDRIVVVTNAGHLLMFSVAELPELDKGGKGNKLIEIPKAKLSSGERVAGVAVVGEGKGEVTLYAGQRKLTLKWADLVEYGGNRATRGSLLPRGLQRVERIEVGI